jgi:hypothetical protein
MTWRGLTFATWDISGLTLYPISRTLPQAT